MALKEKILKAAEELQLLCEDKTLKHVPIRHGMIEVRHPCWATPRAIPEGRPTDIALFLYANVSGIFVIYWEHNTTESKYHFIDEAKNVDLEIKKVFCAYFGSIIWERLSAEEKKEAAFNLDEWM